MRGRLQRGLVVLLAAATLCTGCGDVQVSQPSDGDESGTPVRGGTLKVVGNSDVDHLATVSGYVTGSLWLTRTFARQLVTYPPATDFETAISLEPDVARADTLDLVLSTGSQQLRSQEAFSSRHVKNEDSLPVSPSSKFWRL